MARIAFLLPNMSGGGAERVALTLMTTFIDRGHEVDLVLMSTRGELMAHLPSEVRVFDLKARRVRNMLWPLIGYLRARRPDALQARMWPVTVIAIAARMLSRSSTRVVVSDHSYLSEAYRHSLVKSTSLRLSVRAFYPFADARIAVSNGVAGDLASMAGMDRSRWRVIFNPVPSVIAAAGATDDEPMWPENRARILTVGSLKAPKNQALLVQALAKLPPEREAHLMIVGEGPLRSELERLAGQLGVSGHVSFPGFKADPTPYYRSADLFVLSSDHEGFGNVLIEALQAGLPVVSTNCPSGPAEILGGGQFGKLVPCNDADALAEAIEAALSGTVDAEGQRDRALELSGHHILDDYLEVLLSGQGDGRHSSSHDSLRASAPPD